MNRKFTSHMIVYFMIYLMILLTFASRWTVEWLQLPSIVSKITTVGIYLPFCLCIVWKLIIDLKAPQKNLFNYFYYIFMLYYIVLSAYRFFTGAEIKENLYYSMVLLGSLAVSAQLVLEKKNVVNKTIIDDLCILALIVVLYRACHLLFLRKYVWYSPINEITLVAVMILLLPVVCKRLSEADGNITFWTLFCTLLIFGISVSLLTFGSRIGFFVFIITITTTIIIFIKEKRTIRIITASLLCATSFVVILFALNVGDVRYAVSREMNISLSSSWMQQSEPEQTQPSTALPQITSAPSATEVPDGSQSSLVENQIKRSDSMRNNLFQLSLEQIRKNPWFGTGDVLFTHAYSGQEGVVEAPAHNIILQTLNCYGIIGFILIAICLVGLLIQIGLFRRDNRIMQRNKLLVILIIVVFGGISMVQATGYDVLALPLTLIIIVSLAKSFSYES